MNKSAEIILNTTSQVATGKNVAEALTSKNSHFMATVSEVAREKPFACLMKSHITTTQGNSKSGEQSDQKIPINFYASKLLDQNKKAYGYCLILQPIV